MLCFILLILFKIRTLISAYPDGTLIWSDDCNSQSTGWYYEGLYVQPYAFRYDCPFSTTQTQCFCMMGSVGIDDGLAIKSFSTAGYWDVWLTIDIHIVNFDQQGNDKCYVSYRTGPIFDQFAGFDSVAGSYENTLIENLASKYWNNPNFGLKVEIVADAGTDYCYFSNIRVGGKLITPFPTFNPTTSPTFYTFNPTISPTKFPTYFPTSFPTNQPTFNPTNLPTNNPTNEPTMIPSTNPTITPTLFPSAIPTLIPSINPTNSPTKQPHASGKASDSITTTTNDSVNTAVSPQSSWLIIVAVISIISFILCIISLVYFMKKYKSFKKSQSNVKTMKNDDIAILSSNMSKAEPKITMISSVSGSIQTSEEEIVPIPIEIQMEGIRKSNAEMVDRDDELYQKANHIDDDGIFGAYKETGSPGCTTKGDEHNEQDERNEKRDLFLHDNEDEEDEEDDICTERGTTNGVTMGGALYFSK